MTKTYRIILAGCKAVIILSCMTLSFCNRATIQPQAVTPPTPTPLAIDKIAPVSGAVQITDTITGTGFSSVATDDRVFFNGKSANVITASATQLIVNVPAQATTGEVSVKVGDSTANGPVFTVLSIPVISSINPTHGLTAGSDTIIGMGFSAVANNDIVSFNGQGATVVSASANRIVVTIPASTTGTVSVTVNGVLANGPVFTYDSAVVNDSVTVSTLAGSGANGEQDGIGSAASFSFVWGLAADNNGNVFVADGDNNLIREVTGAGVVTTVAGAGSQLAEYGPGTFFYYPVGVAVDNDDSIYVADHNTGKIFKISNGNVNLLAGSVNGYADGVGAAANFDEPTGVAVDNNGNVYVADYMNNDIRKITPDGTVSTLAGGGSTNPGSADGLGTAATFRQPWGVAVDGSGNVYVADAGNNEIRKITASGRVTTVAGNLTGGSADGVGAAAGFGEPRGVAVDANRNLYVADYLNNEIRKITPSGIVTTIAGTGATGAADGSGKTATFNQPIGVSIDGNGNIYVADGTNFKIRKIVIQH